MEGSGGLFWGEFDCSGGGPPSLWALLNRKTEHPVLSIFTTWCLVFLLPRPILVKWLPLEADGLFLNQMGLSLMLSIVRVWRACLMLSRTSTCCLKCTLMIWVETSNQSPFNTLYIHLTGIMMNTNLSYVNIQIGSHLFENHYVLGLRQLFI